MSKIKILIAAHKVTPLLNTEIFDPIHVGRALSSNKVISKMSHCDGDDTGKNISIQNRRYAEVTALYWAWKNIPAGVQYIGLMHYSRYFNFLDIQYEHPSNIFNDLSDEVLEKYGLKDSVVSDLCSKYDVICPDRWEMRKEHIEYEHNRYNYKCELTKQRLAEADEVLNMYDHYSICHVQDDMDMALEIMKERFPAIYKTAQKSLKKTTARFANMFIMRRDLFDQYCNYLFTIINCMESKKRYDSDEYKEGGFNSRVFGFLSERLFSIYIDYLETSRNDIRILDRQIVFAQYVLPLVEESKQVSEDTMNIVMSSDNAYAPYLTVALLSLFTNSNKKDYFKIFVLDGGISNRNKRKIRSFVIKFGHSITFVDIDLKRFKNACPLKDESKHITLPTYFRFSTASLLPLELDRVLYLDVDIIVKSSVFNLYHEDFDDSYAVVVTDTLDLCRTQGKKLGLKEKDNYFNAGIMLINLSKWRRDNIEEKFFNDVTLIKKDIIFVDQDVLNYSLKGNVKYVSFEWNIQQTAYHFTRTDLNLSDLQSAKDNPKIIHYSGHIKPWDKWFRCWHPNASQYYKYWKASPFRNSYYELILSRFLFRIVHVLFRWRFEYIYLGKGKLKNLFDYKFYLEENPDVLYQQVDPLLHYLKIGWKEGRNPSGFFNTKAYLLNNPDVETMGINPFFHYLVYGMSENRIKG